MALVEEELPGVSKGKLREGSDMIYSVHVIYYSFGLGS